MKQVNELARFRATRPPQSDWETPDFLERYREYVLEVTAEADARFVENLHRNLRYCVLRLGGGSSTSFCKRVCGGSFCVVINQISGNEWW